MDNNQKKKLFYIAIIILLIVLILFGIWWYLSGKAVPSANTEKPVVNNNQQTLPNNQVPPNPNPVVLPPANDNERGALSVARLFAERFGTFTSQSNFEGIRELTQKSTETMSSWLLNNYIPELRNKYPADKYAGQTTNILSAQIISINENQAEASVRTQQSLKIGTDAPVVKSPTLRLKLIKEGETWLVDNARWE